MTGQGSHPGKAPVNKATSDRLWKMCVEDAERERVPEMKFVYWENSNEGVVQDKSNSIYRFSFLHPKGAMDSKKYLFLE